jgi:hypothetical protein
MDQVEAVHQVQRTNLFVEAFRAGQDVSYSIDDLESLLEALRTLVQFSPASDDVKRLVAYWLEKE